MFNQVYCKGFVLNAIVCAIVYGLISTPAFASTTSEMYRTQAVLKLYEGKHEQALIKLNNAIEADPKDYTAIYYRGVVYSRLGEYEKAIEDITLATKNKADIDGLFFELGYAYYLSKNFEDAKTSLLEAQRKYPEHAPVHYYLGLIYYQQGLYTECVEPLKKAVQLDVVFEPSAAYLLGDAYLQLQQFDKADEVLSGALQVYPDSLYRNSTQALLDKISDKREESKFYYVDVSAGYAYDSNVGLFPDNKLPAVDKDRADDRWFVNLAAGLKIYNENNRLLQVGYDFFNSKHSTLSEYDLQRHALAMDLRENKKAFSWGLRLDYAKSDLDGENFQEIGTVLPNIFINHSRSYLSLVNFLFQDIDYLLEDLQERSSYYYELLYRFYVVGNSSARRKIFAGARGHSENAISKDFDNQGYAADLGYEQNLLGGEFYSLLSYGERNYPDSFVSRKDKHAEINIKYAYPVLDSLFIEGDVSFIDNPSTDPEYDYDRYVGSVLVRWKI